MSKDSATHTLERGEKFPFDASDTWWKESGGKSPPKSATWSQYAARGILADLTDRRGIKQGFDEIDEDVRAEIVESLAEIIDLANKEFQP
jgi:hypothetical protein